MAPLSVSVTPSGEGRLTPHLREQGRVLRRRGSPVHPRGHPCGLHALPRGLIRPRRERPVERSREPRRRDVVEDEPRLAVCDRVAQPARGGDEGECAVRQAVHLRQPAGLEPARHEHEVAARVHAVAEGLVVPDPHPDRRRVPCRELAEGALVVMITGSEYRDRAARFDEARQRRKQHVDALLVREPSDDDGERAHRIREAELVQQCAPRSSLSRGRRRRVRVDVRIGLGVPHCGIDAVEDPVQLAAIAPGRHDALEAEPELGRGQL